MATPRLDRKETGAYLPRSLFARGLEPGAEEWQERRITVTSDRVGIEAISENVSNQREWVELDLNGVLKGRWKLSADGEFPGVVLTADNQAYVRRTDRETRSSLVFRLNRSTSAWERVDVPGRELYGADGDKLVFAQWPDGIMHLSWYPQPPIN